MVYPLAFKLLFPVNVILTSNYFILAASFEILPSEEMNRSMMDFTEEGPRNLRLEKLTYDSESFALNTGTSMILLLL